MKYFLFPIKSILVIIVIVITIISKSNGEIYHSKCYKCLNAYDTCLTYEDDVEVETSETLICNDQYGCVSDYSMPSMHPDRTSSCYQPGKYGDQCEPGNEGFCGSQMVCQHPFNLTLPPMCLGFKSLQVGEKCISNSECNSLNCDKDKLVCLETQYSCRLNTYWNGKSCIDISNTAGSCTKDSQCPVYNTCNNGICIEKYSLKDGSSCISDSACNISNSLVCIEGKCQVFIKSSTKNCNVDGCLKDYEYCNCDSGLCEQLKIFNDECKNLQYQLDECVYGRCLYTDGYVSPDSCVMKNCGSLVCQHHSKCTNGPCGNNNSSYCISNTYVPNNNTIPNNNNSTNSSESSQDSSSIPTNSSGSIDDSSSSSSNSTNSNGSIDDSSSSNSTNSNGSIDNSSSSNSTNSSGSIDNSSSSIPTNSSESIDNSSSSSSNSTNSNGSIDDSSSSIPTNSSESIDNSSSSSSNSTNSNGSIDNSSSSTPTNSSDSIDNSSSSSNSTNNSGSIDGSSSLNSTNSIGSTDISSNSNQTIDNSSSNSSNSNGSIGGNSSNFPNSPKPTDGSFLNSTENPTPTGGNALNSTGDNGFNHYDDDSKFNSTNSSYYSFSLFLLLLPILTFLMLN